MDHDVAREFAWCRVGVPHPTAAEVKALLTDLDTARATIAEQATPSAPVSPNLSDP